MDKALGFIHARGGWSLLGLIFVVPIVIVAVLIFRGRSRKGLHDAPLR
jgi:hypothetical protein